MNRYLQNREEALRQQARALISEKGLKLSETPNGHARITGNGLDLRLTDLKYLTPNDIAAEYIQAYQ